MSKLAALVAVAVTAAGCGATRHAATTTVRPASTAPARASTFRIGVVGQLDPHAQGVSFASTTLAKSDEFPFVLVSARAATLSAVAARADANPSVHYAYVGGSTRGTRRPNLVGVVLRHDEAALLGGITAGAVAVEEAGAAARIAWVGPQEEALAAVFADGARLVAPDVVVLHSWSSSAASRCKEAALATIARGADVVMARGGLCAEAVAAAAHDQNRAALSTHDFELPSVAADVLARDAAGGLYHGGEDILFGATSGAIGVRRLDPRISADAALRVRAAAQQLASGLRPSG